MALYLDEKMTTTNLPARLVESFLSKKARLRRGAGLNHKTKLLRQLDKGKNFVCVDVAKHHITHALAQVGH